MTSSKWLFLENPKWWECWSTMFLTKYKLRGYREPIGVVWSGGHGWKGIQNDEEQIRKTPYDVMGWYHYLEHIDECLCWKKFSKLTMFYYSYPILVLSPSWNSLSHNSDTSNEISQFLRFSNCTSRILFYCSSYSYSYLPTQLEQ